MKNIAIIVLSVLVAAAVISGIVVYRQHLGTKDALQSSEEKLLGLNEEVEQLNQEISTLREQIEGNAGRLKELKIAKVRVSELEEALNMKDTMLSKTNEKLQELRKDLEEVNKTKETLAHDLQERLEKGQSDIESLQNQLASLEEEKNEEIKNSDALIADLQDRLEKGQSEIEGFRKQFSVLEEQKRAAESQLGQVKSAYEATISNLKVQVKDKEALATNLQQRLEKNKTEIEDLHKQFSVLEEQKNAAESQIGRVKSTYEATISNLKVQVKDKEALAANLQQRLEKGQSDIESLQNQLADLEEERNEEIKNSDALIADLQDRLEKGKNDIEGLQNQLADLEEEKNEEIRNSDALIADLQDRLEKGEREIAGLKNQLAVLEEKKGAAESTISGLKEEVKNRDTLIVELQGILEGVKSKFLSLTEEFGKGQGELENLQKSLSELRVEKSHLKTRIGHLRSTHKAMVSQLKKQIQNKEVTINKLEEKLSITFVDRILFESGKAMITPEGEKILTKVGNILRNVHEKQIRVIGHTDNVPIMVRSRDKFPSNWELSTARAAAVVRHFQNNSGLDPTKLEAVGCSFYEPIASNKTEEGRALNRRVNIIIAPKIE